MKMKTNVSIRSTEYFLALNLRGTVFLSKASLKQCFSFKAVQYRKLPPSCPWLSAWFFPAQKIRWMLCGS